MKPEGSKGVSRRRAKAKTLIEVSIKKNGKKKAKE
jgi:hypothetical protein